MCFEIRSSLPGDLGPALRLDRVAFGPDAWTFLDYAWVFTTGVVKKFTAVAEGRFAGFAAAELDNKEGAMCMLTLAVSPEFRRKGIGAALLEECEKAFPDVPSFLYVDNKNGSAIRLYQRAGYEVKGIHPSYYMNGHDALVMEKNK